MQKIAHTHLGRQRTSSARARSTSQNTTNPAASTSTGINTRTMFNVVLQTGPPVPQSGAADSADTHWRLSRRRSGSGLATREEQHLAGLDLDRAAEQRGQGGCDRGGETAVLREGPG